MDAWLMFVMGALVIGIGAWILWAEPRSGVDRESNGRDSRIGAIILLCISVGLILLVGQLY